MKTRKNQLVSITFLCILSVICISAVICGCSVDSLEKANSDLLSSQNPDSTTANITVTTDHDPQVTLSPATSVVITTQNTTTQPIVTTQPITEVTKPVYVYSGAIEDFLLPLEEFSWDRIYAPELIMLHFTSAVVNHRDDPYNMEYVRQTFIDYDVSIHYIVERNGTVRCYIPEDRVAWHAGKGEFADDPKYTNSMNQYAIGIEIVGMGSESDMSIYLTSKEYKAIDDSLKGFTDEQYAALGLLIDDLCKRYGITKDRDHIIGHEEYSPKKNDPGELFDWDRVILN